MAVVTVTVPGLLGARCGPTDVEAAGAVLVASPVVILVGALILYGLTALYRRSDPRVAWRSRPVAVFGVAMAAAAALTLSALSDTEVAHWVPTALFFYGLSYLSLLLVVWRFWLAVDPSRASTWAWLPVCFVQLVPAVAIAAGSGGSDLVGLVWVAPGWMGIPPGVLSVALLIEGWVRMRKA